MQYRELGHSGIEVSALGFGCMRFPTVDKGNEHISMFERPIKETEVEEMLVYAVEKGINYFDTAYPYHGGRSEKIVGKVLKPYRHKVMITTKLPARMVQKPSDIQKFFNEQMERLDTEYLDFYLLHGLNRHTWANMKEYGALDFIEKLMSEGTVRHTGFSFHDEVRIFKEIVDGYDWTLCQIQYNFFDENRQAGREGLQYAASKGMGVVIMEPLRGGSLTGNQPPSVQAIWDSANLKRTPAEWGLRWVFNQPEVSLVLSGMSAMAQVIENINVVEDAKAGSLNEEELALVSKVQEEYEEMLKVDCTGCGYCMPCSNGVDIPMNFGAYNDYYIFDDHRPALMRYNRMMAEEQRASNCQDCGECEEKCPQKIGIVDELKNVHALLHNEEESNI